MSSAWWLILGLGLLACVIAGSASFAVNSVVVSKRKNPPVIAADVEQAAAAVLEVRHRVLRAFRVLQASSERATCALRVVSRTSWSAVLTDWKRTPTMAITRKAALSEFPCTFICKSTCNCPSDQVDLFGVISAQSRSATAAGGSRLIQLGQHGFVRRGVRRPQHRIQSAHFVP